MNKTGPLAQKLGDFVTITRADHVAQVTLERGVRLTTLSIQAMRELKSAAHILREDADIHAIIVK